MAFVVPNSNNTVIASNRDQPGNPFIVTFNLNNCIVKCSTGCQRFTAFQICEHLVVVSERRKMLQNFQTFLNEL